MRALILIIGAALAVGITASLTGCNGVGSYQYDMAKVDASFKACMNSTPTPSSSNAFERKIHSCETVAYASNPQRFVKL